MFCFHYKGFKMQFYHVCFKFLAARTMQLKHSFNHFSVERSLYFKDLFQYSIARHFLAGLNASFSSSNYKSAPALSNSHNAPSSMHLQCPLDFILSTSSQLSIIQKILIMAGHYQKKNVLFSAGSRQERGREGGEGEMLGMA